MDRIKLKERLLKKEWGLTLYSVYFHVRQLFSRRVSDFEATNQKFRRVFGRDLNLENPTTLNEKLQWLKFNVRLDIQTVLADKYGARKFIAEHFGEEYLVPLLYETTNWRDITMDVIPDEPCIIKPNHGSGQYVIIRDKKKVDIKDLRAKCLIWLMTDFYRITREWQYKNIKRRVIIEKLLQTKDGTIPNDYKLNYFNGKLEFIYCSVGRESGNKRNVYDADWNPIYFSWVEPEKDATNIRGEEIPAPSTIEKMKEIGSEIAKMFSYVRVDFYDVDGKLYVGEITFHHGGGFDVFTPAEYDLYYGQKLVLPSPK